MDSEVVGHRLSCSVACGFFLGQGLNPCLHWHMDSQPTGPPGKPHMGSLKEALDPGFAFTEHISLRGLECCIYVVVVVFSHSVVSDSLRPHELQHA